VVPPEVAAIQRAGGFSITAFSLDRVTKARPLVALGVAPGTKRGDVRLAVRLQRHSLERSETLLGEIRKRARDEVDIRFVGQIAKHAGPWYRSRLRPLRPGGSAGHFRITAGTIGAFARERASGKIVILSNNHVLANENDAKVGDAILQPCNFDGGKRARDAIATLHNWVDLKPNGKNEVDAAVAKLKRSIDFDPLNYDAFGNLAGVRTQPILERIAVSKVGRTTGLTRGRITATEIDDVVVSYDVGSVAFDDQIEMESAEGGPFSSGGDSGSLILDEDMNACGLLFAGSEAGGAGNRGLTYANPIATVLSKLAIELPAT
jgi:hypothetical protein